MPVFGAVPGAVVAPRKEAGCVVPVEEAGAKALVPVVAPVCALGWPVAKSAWVPG